MFFFSCLPDHPEVVIFIENRKLVMQTTRTWDYLGLFSTPASCEGLLNETDMGSGAIIGVIDSGITSISMSVLLHSQIFSAEQ